MSLTMKVKRGKTKDLEKVLKHFQTLNNLKIDVGYFSDSGQHSTAEMSYSELMAFHEGGGVNQYGHSVPARPLMSEAVFELEESGKKVMMSEYKNLFGQVGRINFNADALGDKMVVLSRELFGDTYLFEDNAPSTIAKKGKNSPLEDTGELRDNLGYKTTENRSVRK